MRWTMRGVSLDGSAGRGGGNGGALQGRVARAHSRFFFSSICARFVGDACGRAGRGMAPAGHAELASDSVRAAWLAIS